MELEGIVKMQVDQLVARCQQTGKTPLYSIGNTGKFNAAGPYFPPDRVGNQFICANVIVFSVEEAVAVARCVDGRVALLLVDDEKKIVFEKEKDEYGNFRGNVGNISKSILKTMKVTDVCTFKANDLTVDAVDAMLSVIFPTIGGLRVGVLGLGNIGSKLALKLVERGAHVFAYRRDQEKLKVVTESLNIIKPQDTIACVTAVPSMEDLFSDRFDLVLGTANASSLVGIDHLKRLKPQCVIVDVGKGSISAEAVTFWRSHGRAIHRATIEAAFEGYVTHILRARVFQRHEVGRLRVNPFVAIVSGGYIGESGDVVVDNVRHPSQILGVANGAGEFKTSLSPVDREAVQYVATTFGIVDFRNPS